MRALTLLTAVLIACASPGAGSRATPTSTPTATLTPTPAATRAVTLSCEPTRTRDAAGVITLDDRFGIVGEAFTFGDDMNGKFWLVRRGAVAGDRVVLRFRQVSGAAPATWVEYGVSASPRSTPWGDAAFGVGWKPISFANTCWSLVVDGVETGLVLAVGQ